MDSGRMGIANNGQLKKRISRLFCSSSQSRHRFSHPDAIRLWTTRGHPHEIKTSYRSKAVQPSQSPTMVSKRYRNCPARAFAGLSDAMWAGCSQSSRCHCLQLPNLVPSRSLWMLKFVCWQYWYGMRRAGWSSMLLRVLYRHEQVKALIVDGAVIGAVVEEVHVMASVSVVYALELERI
jgi:hypothetical protein